MLCVGQNDGKTSIDGPFQSLHVDGLYSSHVSAKNNMKLAICNKLAEHEVFCRVAFLNSRLCLLIIVWQILIQSIDQLRPLRRAKEGLQISTGPRRGVCVSKSLRSRDSINHRMNTRKMHRVVCTPLKSAKAMRRRGVKSSNDAPVGIVSRQNSDGGFRFVLLVNSATRSDLHTAGPQSLGFLPCCCSYVIVVRSKKTQMMDLGSGPHIHSTAAD